MRTKALWTEASCGDSRVEIALKGQSNGSYIGGFDTILIALYPAAIILKEHLIRDLRG